MTRSLCVLAALAAAAGLSPARPREVRIAVVRISECFKPDKVDRARELREKFDAERDALVEKLKQCDQALQKAKTDLDGAPPGSDGQIEMGRRYKHAEVEFQMQQAILNDKNVNGLVRYRAAIYNDVLKAISVVAADQYDVVLKLDDSRPDPKDKAELVNQQIALRDVLYASPAVDITDKILEQLNRK